MEEENKVLLELELDEGKVEERIVHIRQSTDDYRKALTDLKKEYSEGEKTQEEYFRAAEKIEGQIRRNNKELQQARKTLDDNKKEQKANTGSLAELRAQLSLNTAAYVEMSREERENAAVGGELIKTTKAIRDEIAEAEKKIGDYRREVGSYEKALDGATGKLEDWLKQHALGGGVLSDFYDTIKDGINAVKTAKEAYKDYKEAQASGAQATGTAAQAVQLFTKGMTLGRIAAIAFVAVPIIAMLAGLFLLLTKSQGGMDKLAQFAKAATAAFDAFTHTFINIGRVVRDAFTSWEKFKNILTDVGAESRKLIPNMAAAAKAGMDIAKANQEIEASEIKLMVTISKNRAQIEKYKKTAEDVTKSQSVRAAAAKAALDLENVTLAESIKLQQRKVKVAQDEAAIGESTREKDRKVAEETVELNNKIEDSTGRQTEYQNQLNQIRQEGIDKAKEAAAQAAMEQIAHYERLKIVAEKNGKDTLQYEIEILRKKAALELLDATKGAEQRKLINVKLQADIFQATVENLAKIETRQNEIKTAGTQASLAISTKGSKAELALLKEQMDNESYARQIAISKRLAGAENAKQREIEISAEALRNTRAKQDLQLEFDKNAAQAANDVALARYETERALQEKTLADQRKFEADLIDIEENAQLKLLALEQIDDDQKLVKQNAIQAKAIAQRKELARQVDLDELSNQKSLLNARLAAVTVGSFEELKIRLAIIEKERQEALKTVKLTAEQRKQIEAEAERKKNDTTKAFNDAFAQNVLKQAEGTKQLMSTIFEAQIQSSYSALQKQQDAALKSAGQNADLRAKIEENFAKRKEKLDKEAAEKRKKIALVENLISIARGVTEAIRIPQPFGAIQAALVVATGIAQQAAIEAQQFNKGGVPKESTVWMNTGQGGYIATGAGTSTSDSIKANLSVTESVMNAKATRKYYNELSYMNAETGGVPFPNAKPVSSPIPKTMGFRYGTVGSSYDNLVMTKDAMVEAMSKTKTVLIYKDLTDVQAEDSRITNRTTIKID